MLIVIFRLGLRLRFFFDVDYVAIFVNEVFVFSVFGFYCWLLSSLVVYDFLIDDVSKVFKTVELDLLVVVGWVDHAGAASAR